MRQVLNKSMIVMAAASGILTAAGGYAHADASAEGAAVGSPGVGSGNAVQVPVHVPVNLCGNTVDVIALLNPAFGNTCANVGPDEGDHRGGGPGAHAEAEAADSPGVLSGNVVQAPVDIPVNACGNSVDIVGLLNPAFGNTCVNDSGPGHPNPPVQPPAEEPPVEEPPAVQPPTEEPPVKAPPVNEPPAVTPPVSTPPANTPETQLAETGAGDIGMAAGASAALLLGGAVLMRRSRAARD
ncbi:chaplin [Streptomyces sp. NBC_01754]|uniref:chaplin n=1 Tax=Streptomyces sp. NBC_01754 TaxID=2975930 RepID=UPI002DDA506D|nr:chaplin family protein [Streptomyces sp. NBC_01754]